MADAGIRVLGHWELGYHAPVTEQHYWALALRDFGVTHMDMVPVSGVSRSDQAVELHEWARCEDFFEAHPDLHRVFIEPRTDRFNPVTTWLHEFEHPESCVYVFGSAHMNPTLNHCRPSDVVVSIRTEGNSGVLWADQAMCIVLYDRMVKSWR